MRGSMHQPFEGEGNTFNFKNKFQTINNHHFDFKMNNILDLIKISRRKSYYRRALIV